MWRHPILKVLFFGYVAWGGWHWFSGRPLHRADGILAPQDPQQNIESAGKAYRMGRWTLTARAAYQITARVLSVERYRFDALAGLIPEDLALGWGPMSDSGVLRQVEISQSNRFYFWRRSGNGYPTTDVIIQHSANTHVIPANAGVARRLSQLRPGQVVALSGELVDGVRDDGGWIKTSLTRTDTGAGACEVMLVQELEVMQGDR